jgi:putative ABC transport system permease protein
MAESEIWTDATVLQGAYNRGDTYQSVYAKLVAPDAFFMFSNALAIDPRLNVKVLRQSEYYAEQSSVMTKLIKTLGYVVASLMAIGAVFGALNTMYTAVSSRTREIATLRALGFGSGSVVVSIMLESMVLALVGGSIGAAVAHLVFHNFHTATMNFQSFSQVTFAFDVTPQLLAQGIIWATVIGLIGGLFPALRAAHLPIAAALREL